VTTLQLLGYVSDVWVLSTYFWLAHRSKTLPFHWANALGAVPLLVAEYQLGAWQVIPLTGTFCLLGWFGLAKAWRAKRARNATTQEMQGIVVRLSARDEAFNPPLRTIADHEEMLKLLGVTSLEHQRHEFGKVWNEGNRHDDGHGIGMGQ
jgi:hypothetical protein